jgi:CheY-like chemotaxis protein
MNVNLVRRAGQAALQSGSTRRAIGEHERDAMDAGSKPPTIMVVEDTPSSLYLMRRLVEKHGCHMVSTGLGELALEVARKEQPAAIVLDVLLPGISGWDVLRALKADRATRRIPVLLCSVLDEEVRGREEGASGYLHKPVLCSDFAAALGGIGLRPQAREHPVIRRKKGKEVHGETNRQMGKRASAQNAERNRQEQGDSR